MSTSKLRYAITLTAGLAATTLAAAQQPLIMEKVTLRDPMVDNKEAISFLMPKGWKTQGGVKWYPDLEHQACFEIKVGNPNGLEQIECLPWVKGCWFSNPVIPLQVGSNYLGTVVMQPIEDPAEVIRKLTIPLARKGARIVGSTNMPDLAKVLSAINGGVRVRSAKVRLEYDVNGQAVEEDIYLSIYLTSMNLGVNNCIAYHWGPAWTPFALRAPKGELDKATPLLLAVVNSAKVNPSWFADHAYVCQLFQDRMAKGIDNGRRLSETLRENSEQISKMFSDAYWKRQASQDRLSQQFSDSIRGVQRYHSPHDRHPVQLPSGYNHVWTNPQGQYILSNNAGYDPNVGSTQQWSQLKTAR